MVANEPVVPSNPVKEPGGFARSFRENTEAIVVAFTFALIIRCFFLEVFQIPTTSMEPTLLGDVSGGQHHGNQCPFIDFHQPGLTEPASVDASGDRIMVTKFYYGLSKIDRYDVVVFKYPLNVARNFIKRVVGLPGEWMVMYGGNIYSGQSENGPFTITRKTPSTQGRIWIRADSQFEEYLQKKSDFDRFWQAEDQSEYYAALDLRPGASEADIAKAYKKLSEEFHPDRNPAESNRYARVVEAYNVLKDPRNRVTPHEVIEGKLITGRRSAFRHGAVRDYPNGVDVDDLRLSFEVNVASPQGAIFARIENRYGKFELRLAGKGSTFVYTNPEGHPTTRPIAARPESGFHRVEIEIYDGRYFVRYDGDSQIPDRNEFLSTLAEAKSASFEDRGIVFGSEDTPCEIRKLSLARDIHYRERPGGANIRDGEAKQIEPGYYVMMGDNTESSHDSRAWTEHTWLLKDGREVVFESKAIEDGAQAGDQPAFKHLVDPKRPRRDFVKEDRFGNAVPIYEDEFDTEKSVRKFYQVHESYIVGRALWVWFPLNRFGRLIR